MICTPSGSSLRHTAQEARPELAARLGEAAARVPGVRHAAVSVVEPMSGMGWNGPISVPGGPERSGRDRMSMFNAITPGWFSTYGTRIVAGRDFNRRDDRGAPVAIVNEAFARHFFGTPAAVGRRVVMETGPGQSAELEIVGVATAAAYRGVRSDFPPTLYRPAAQMTGQLPPFFSLALRTTPGGASGLHAAVTRVVRDVDPTLTLTFRTMAGRVRDELTEIRAIALLSSFFGVLALVLAGIGLYGVTSYGVAERRREIGIRPDPRRGPRAGAAPGAAARRPAGRHRHRARRRRQRRPHAAAAVDAVPARTARPDDHRRFRRRARRDRTARRLAAGTAGVTYRSRAGAERGLTSRATQPATR